MSLATQDVASQAVLHSKLLSVDVVRALLVLAAFQVIAAQIAAMEAFFNIHMLHAEETALTEQVEI